VDRLLLAGIIVVVVLAASVPALYLLSTSGTTGGEAGPAQGLQGGLIQVLSPESTLYKSILEYWETRGVPGRPVIVPLSAPAGTVTVTAATMEAEPSYSSGNFQVEGVVEDDIAAFNGTHLYVLSGFAGETLEAYRVYPSGEAGHLWSLDTASVCRDAAPSIRVSIEVGGVVSSTTLHIELIPHGIVLGDGVIYLLCTPGTGYYRFLPGAIPLVHVIHEKPSFSLVAAVSPENGSVLWTSNLTGSIVGARLVDERLIVVTSAPTAIFLYYEPIPYLPIVDGQAVEEDEIIVAGEPGYYVTVAEYGPEGLQAYNVTAAGRPTAIVATGWGLAVAAVEDGKTRILSFQAGESVEYAGDYLAGGYVDSQWQLQPYTDEYLIVVYSDAGAGVGLVVLRGPGLEPVGALEGLIRNQDVHGVRLLGNTLYFVTFRMVDPLFAVDLSDPTSPKVLGYLEAPGFDEYLHPTRHGLLGVGIEGEEVRVSLYRLDDGVPVPVDRIYLPAMGTPLLSANGHRAFAYLPERDLALVPVNGLVTIEDGPYYMVPESLYFAVKVEADGLSLAGTVGVGARAYWVEDQIVVVNPFAANGTLITLYNADTLEPVKTLGPGAEAYG